MTKHAPGKKVRCSTWHLFLHCFSALVTDGDCEPCFPSHVKPFAAKHHRAFTATWAYHSEHTAASHRFCWIVPSLSLSVFIFTVSYFAVVIVSHHHPQERMSELEKALLKQFTARSSVSLSECFSVRGKNIFSKYLSQFTAVQQVSHLHNLWGALSLCGHLGERRHWPRLHKHQSKLYFAE